jgi:hypothetical protein
MAATGGDRVGVVGAVATVAILGRRFVAAVDASIARGELETCSADLATCLGGLLPVSPRSCARHTTF